MQHTAKCALVSLLPLFQLGCAPPSHDQSSRVSSGSPQFWKSVHDAKGEYPGPVLTRSSEDEKVQWHLTLICNPNSVSVEIAAPSEYIMPVLLPGALGRRADVSYRFEDEKPVASLWQIDPHRRPSFCKEKTLNCSCPKSH